MWTSKQSSIRCFISLNISFSSVNSETSVKKLSPSKNASDSSDDASAYLHGSYTVNGSMMSYEPSEISLASSTPVLERIQAYNHSVESSKSPPVFRAPPPPPKETFYNAPPEADNSSNTLGVTMRHKKDEGGTGSLREAIKAKRNSSQDIFREVQTPDITDQLVNKEEETDYIKMSNDLLQNFIRQSKLSDQSDHSDQRQSVELEPVSQRVTVAKLDKTCDSLGELKF
jgi:hypothetical protein